MLYQNMLLTLRIIELEQQIDILMKRKTRKRRRIQHSRIIEYSTILAQVATEGSSSSKRAKKQRTLGSDKPAHSALGTIVNAEGLDIILEHIRLIKKALPSRIRVLFILGHYLIAMKMKLSKAYL
jgi:hypothetical protein